MIGIEEQCELACSLPHTSQPDQFDRRAGELLTDFPPLDGVRGGRRGRKDRYKAYTDRAKEDWLAWLGTPTRAAAE